MNLLPALRMISATSQGGRVTPSRPRPVAPIHCGWHRDLIEWIGRRMQMALRQVKIHRGVFQMRMPHQELNRAQVGSGFEQGCRKTVAHSVRTDGFPDSRPPGGLPAGVPDSLVRNGFLHPTMSFGAGEQIDLWPLPPKILPQNFQQLGRHRYVAIPRTLALLNM